MLISLFKSQHKCFNVSYNNQLPTNLFRSFEIWASCLPQQPQDHNLADNFNIFCLSFMLLKSSGNINNNSQYNRETFVIWSIISLMCPDNYANINLVQQKKKYFNQVVPEWRIRKIKKIIYLKASSFWFLDISWVSALLISKCFAQFRYIYHLIK